MGLPTLHSPSEITGLSLRMGLLSIPIEQELLPESRRIILTPRWSEGICLRVACSLSISSTGTPDNLVLEQRLYLRERWKCWGALWACHRSWGSAGIHALRVLRDPEQLSNKSCSAAHVTLNVPRPPHPSQSCGQIVSLP